MKTEVFSELLGSAREALEHAQGKRDLATTAGRPKLPTGRGVRTGRTARVTASRLSARKTARNGS
jgi:hypothetical protein